MLILIDGNERVGKTTVAKALEEKGFKYIHMSAPSKKYKQPGYAGLSFLEDMVELYMSLAGQNVVIDRTIRGELVYPQVFGREPMLTEEDIQILREIEDSMDCVRILMYDSDESANWKRCIENKEPINGKQFKLVNKLFNDIADKHGYIKYTMHQLMANGALDKIINGEVINNVEDNIQHTIIPSNTDTVSEIKDNTTGINMENNRTIKSGSMDTGTNVRNGSTLDSLEQRKLAEANAIDEVIRARIIKKKGEYFDILEDKIRKFLYNELTLLLGTNKSANKTANKELTNEEIDFLRILINKAKGGK